LMDLDSFRTDIWPSGWRLWDAQKWRPHLETQIARALDELEQLQRDLTLWQKDQLRWAIGATARGLYPLAATALYSSLTNDGVSESRWPTPDARPTEVEHFTIETFRKCLQWLREQPTQQSPVFM
jgi:hypothetical protein